MILAGCARELRKRGVSSPTGRTALLVAGVAIMAAVQFGICVALEGLKDLIKHLYLFQVLFDVCFLAALAYLAGRLAGIRRAGCLTRLAGEGTGPPTTPGTS